MSGSSPESAATSSTQNGAASSTAKAAEGAAKAMPEQNPALKMMGMLKTHIRAMSANTT